MRHQLIIAYDGTPFGGWQAQMNSVAIQSLIEKALSTILREEISLFGSGRTDAGVHAFGQSAHFDTTKSFEPRRLILSGNALLPPEIRLMNVQEVSKDFHARYDATGKIYHYHIHLDKAPDPFKRLYSYHFPYPLDLNILNESAPYFLGTHDFSSFANEAREGSAAKNAVRTLTRLDIIEEPGGIRLEFEGNGFLYKMVRNITGTLIDIARGKHKIEEIPEMLAAKDRKRAGTTAPALGLCLVQVLYLNQKNEITN